MPLLTDLARQHSVRQVAGATEIVRTFRVSGLLSSPSQVLLDALTFPGVPDIGDGYPGFSQYRVREKDAVPDGNGIDALVTVTYSDKTGNTWNQSTPADDGEDVKQFSSTLVQQRRVVDIALNPMQLDPPLSYAGSNSYLSEAIGNRPIGVLNFERSESLPPSSRMRNNVGRVNTPGIALYPERSLLFSRLDAESVDGGRVWRVSYEFRYDPELWTHKDWWKNGRGRVPSDAAQVEWLIYPAFDFATLGLDFADTQTPLP